MKLSLLLLFVISNTVVRSSWLIAQNIDSMILKSFLLQEKLPVEIGVDESTDIRILAQAEKAILSKNEFIRFNVFSLINSVGIRTKSITVKQKALNLLLNSATDSIFAIREGFHEVFRYYDKIDFDDAFKTKLKLLIHNKDSVNRGLILLVGYLEMKEEMYFIEKNYAHENERFKNEFTINNQFNTINFAAYLCLAKMGNVNALNYTITKMRSLSDNELILECFGDLSYLRNDASIKVLINYLMLEGKLPPTEGPFNELYANRALHVLSGIFKNFPIKKRQSALYNELEIDTARKWVTANSGNIEIEDNKW